MKINEFCMSVDDFENPLILKDEEAIATLLTRIILLEPGTNQSHPDMGVGIISRFRYSNTEEASKLQAEIKRQVDTYFPTMYSGIQINVKPDKDIGFFITAEIDSTIYGLQYDINTSEISKKYLKLSEL